MSEHAEGRPLLDPIELRVVASLVEKRQTVPDTYPMTLKGLVSACNQSSSREPVMALADHDVAAALDRLKAAGLVRFVHPSQGARATKYRHVLDEAWALDEAEQAVLAVLALRGDQTLNELRTRTERAHAFASTDEVEGVLDALAARPDPLVVHLGRRPGQREDRWRHLLAGAEDHEPVAATEPAESASSAPPAPDRPSVPTRASDDAVVARLEGEVHELRTLVDHLYDVLGERRPDTTSWGPGRTDPPIS